MASTFTDACLANIGLTLGTAYECPGNTKAILIHNQISNKTSNLLFLDIVKVDSSNNGAQIYLVKNLEVPPGDVCVPIDGQLVLNAGDSIQAKASAENSLSYSLSFMEIGV